MKRSLIRIISVLFLIALTTNFIPVCAMAEGSTFTKVYTRGRITDPRVDRMKEYKLTVTKTCNLTITVKNESNPWEEGIVFNQPGVWVKLFKSTGTDYKDELFSTFGTKNIFSLFPRESYKGSLIVKKGTYTLRACGEAAYRVTVQGKYVDVALSKVKLSTTKYTYNGKPCQPTVTVQGKVDGRTVTLTKDTDYTVTYKNNIKAGTATVIVKGIGGVKGTIKKTFIIKPAKILKVTLSSNSLPYTGKARKSIPTVKAKLNGEVVTLTKGTDYTVTYKNNIKVGTATVIITGKGNYTGTITKTFSIVKK